MNPRRTGLLLLVAIVLSSAPTTQAALRKSVVSNGGATHSGSGRQLRGTVGQAAVGRSSGSGRTLGSGYWGGGRFAVTSVGPPSSGPGAKRFAFSAAMPSPTSSEASFELTLPTSSRMEMKVFDVTGRQVDALASALLDPGDHMIRWRASSFAAGVYLAQLLVNGEVRATRRVVLVR